MILGCGAVIGRFILFQGFVPFHHGKELVDFVLDAGQMVLERRGCLFASTRKRG